MQRVMIIENQLLVGAGIQLLLQDNPDIEVIGLTPTRQADLADGIQQHKPDVIVLREGNYLLYMNLLMPILHALHKFRILVISAEFDIIGVYEKQEASAANANQLVSLIQNV